jgi:hypothetical protein
LFHKDDGRLPECQNLQMQGRRLQRVQHILPRWEAEWSMKSFGNEGMTVAAEGGVILAEVALRDEGIALN